MSTKKTSTSTNQYNPAGMQTYNSLQPGVSSTLQDFMNDPQKSSFFNQLLKQASESIGGRTQTALGNLTNPAMGANVSNPSAFFADQIRRTSLGGQRMQSDALTNLLLGSAQLRLGAAGQASSFRPLQTGNTNVETTGGLGTWLPQLAGAGLGIAMGGFGGFGGLGKMMGGGGGGGFSSYSGPGSQVGYGPQLPTGFGGYPQDYRSD